jgi:hypothetical protein
MTTSLARNCGRKKASTEIASGVKLQQLAHDIEYGMPTPRAPLNLLDMGYMVEKAEPYMERADCAAWDSEDIYLS